MISKLWNYIITKLSNITKEKVDMKNMFVLYMLKWLACTTGTKYELIIVLAVAIYLHFLF